MLQIKMTCDVNLTIKIEIHIFSCFEWTVAYLRSVFLCSPVCSGIGKRILVVHNDLHSCMGWEYTSLFLKTFTCEKTFLHMRTAFGLFCHYGCTSMLLHSFCKTEIFFNCTFYLRYRALPFLTKHYFDIIEVLDVNRIHHFSLLISIGYKRLLVTLNFNKKSSTEVFGKERNINMYLGIDKNGWFCSPHALTMTTFSFPAPHTKTLECVVIHSKTRSIVQTWIGHTHILNFFFKKIKKPTIKWCKFIS